jgi:hypothetical protein
MSLQITRAVINAKYHVSTLKMFLTNILGKNAPSDLFVPQLCPEALNPKDVKTTSKSGTTSIWRQNAAKKAPPLPF